MNIKGINKALILKELYNKSKPLGYGALQFINEDMTLSQAQVEIENNGGSFDYLHGRVMKINLNGDDLRTHLYNRDNGENAAENIINNLELDDKKA